jgi:hypothetical protein
MQRPCRVEQFHLARSPVEGNRGHLPPNEALSDARTVWLGDYTCGRTMSRGSSEALDLPVRRFDGRHAGQRVADDAGSREALELRALPGEHRPASMALVRLSM